MRRSSTFSIRLIIGLVLGVSIVSSPIAQNHTGQVEELIRQAREQGMNYLNSRDDRARKIAKKNLDEAEKQLKEGWKRDSNCQQCVEKLVEVYFYQALLRFSGDFNDCLKTAEQGLARFPDNGAIAYYKGFAHFNRQEHTAFQLAHRGCRAIKKRTLLY